MKNLRIILWVFLLITFFHCKNSVQQETTLIEARTTFDDEDLKNIFSIIGIHPFKFPFEVKKGEYVSISYSVYEFGELIEKFKFIEDFMYETGLRFNNHHSWNDTINYHRLYLYEKQDSLQVNVILPSFSSRKRINISNISNIKHNKSNDIEICLDEGKAVVILYSYGLYNDSENFKKLGGWLRGEPSSNISETTINELKEKYDLLIVFYAERISAKKAIELLGEDFYKNLSCPVSK